METITVLAAITTGVALTLAAMNAKGLYYKLTAAKAIREEKEIKEEALKEGRTILEGNMERFKDHYFVAGGVRGVIENYQWKELSIEGMTATFANYHRFIETMYRKQGRLTEYEYYHLRITEEALVDCRKEAKGEDEPGFTHTIIETDDYGTLVRHRTGELLPLGSSGRMAALLLEDTSGDVFIKDIHVSKKGLASKEVVGSVSIYPVSSSRGVRDTKWISAFQMNIEERADEWKEELEALADLREEVKHWNAHKDFVELDMHRGVWIVQPKLFEPKVEEAPTPASEPILDAKGAALDALSKLGREDILVVAELLNELTGEAAATNERRN